jgi:preprotein translocase subunit YajC
MTLLNLITTSSPLLAADAAPSGGPNMLVMMVLMFVMMYFMVIRPQQKRAKELADRIAALKVGDDIVTTAGLHATVHSIKETTVMLKVAEGIKLEFDKSAVAAVATKSAGA